jgi:chromate transporter
MANSTPLAEVAKVFLKLGCIGFGGPAAHIAMMEKEVVTKRKWMTSEHFLDLIGATNLIPGPNSTEMTMHCGHERAGWKGLIIAGLCFITPAVIITGAIAWAYTQYGRLPEVQPFVYGIKPAIIAIILSLVITLGKKAWKSNMLGLIGVISFVVALAGVNEIAVLFGAGILGIIINQVQRSATLHTMLPFTFLQALPLTETASTAKIFWIFLKVGSILYGSGYVLFAFLDAELVSTNLLSRQVLIDAIAVGQFTPGPVFSSATFIGWQMGGWQGALAATIGIFLPSFLFVGLLNPLIPRLRKSAVMGAFLDTVNIASIALILTVVIQMGKETFLDWRTIAIAISGFVVTFTFRNINTAFIITGGALLGYVLSFV